MLLVLFESMLVAVAIFLDSNKTLFRLLNKTFRAVVDGLTVCDQLLTIKWCSGASHNEIEIHNV